jgi:hypothetical protein
MPAAHAYEYRVVPAPKRGIKTRTARTSEDRFAAALEASLNELGAEGWEFVRADTLPSEERGLTGRSTVQHTVLIYRRPVASGGAEDFAGRRLATPAGAQSMGAPTLNAPVATAPVMAAPLINAPVVSAPVVTAPAATVQSPVAPHLVAPSPVAPAVLSTPPADLAQAPAVLGVTLPDAQNQGAQKPQRLPSLGAAGPRLAGQ